MESLQPLFQIRTKKLAALILDARLKSGKSAEECAAHAGLSLEDYQLVEKGRLAPTLPQMELIGYFLRVPLEHFWDDQTIATTSSDVSLQPDEHNEQRQIEIGQRLVEIRTAAEMTAEQLAEKLGIDIQTWVEYESGSRPIPLPVMDGALSILKIPVEDLFSQEGELGLWLKQLEFSKQYFDLPKDLQDFILKPVNRPYLELAVRLSTLSVDKLRAVAEGLLEITY
jgi:transcriptional regulator with XRE-family HTH domain